MALQADWKKITKRVAWGLAAAVVLLVAAVLIATLVIVAAARFSRTVALCLLGIEALFALRSVLRLVGEPMLDVFLTAINYPGSRYDYRDPDAPALAIGRTIECFFFVGSLLILSPLLYA